MAEHARTRSRDRASLEEVDDPAFALILSYLLMQEIKLKSNGENNGERKGTFDKKWEIVGEQNFPFFCKELDFSGVGGGGMEKYWLSLYASLQYWGQILATKN